MNATVYAYRAKTGMENDLIAWYQDLQRHLCRTRGFLFAELLANTQDPADFITVIRFTDEESAWAHTDNPDYRARYARLVSLTEAGPIVSHYQDVSNDEPARQERGR